MGGWCFVLLIWVVGGVIVGQQKELGGRLVEDIALGATGGAPEWAKPAEGCAKVHKLGAVASPVQIISSVSWNQRG